MKFLYLIFYACQRIRFLDVESNNVPRCLVPAVCRLLCSNMRGLQGPLVTWPWHHLGITYCCSLRLWSQTCVTCRSCWFPDLAALSCCEMLVFRVCGVRQNLCVHLWVPNLDDRIFYCLLTSMAAVQAEDVRASFLFVGYLTVHHQECLSSTTTNRHYVAAFDFTTVSGCD